MSIVSVNTYLRVGTTLRLNQSSPDRMVEHNRDGRPFLVDQIIYSGGDKATLSGWAIKTNGEVGAIRRDRLKLMIELPSVLQDQIFASYRGAIRRIYEEEVQGHE